MKNNVRDICYDCLVYFRDLLLKNGCLRNFNHEAYLCDIDDIYSCFRSALIYLNNKCK